MKKKSITGVLTAIGPFALALTGVLLLGHCASGGSIYSTRHYICSAFCYFKNKDGALEREWMDGRSENIEKAWKKLQSACNDRTEDRRQAELQIVLKEEMHEFRPADPSRECRGE